MQPKSCPKRSEEQLWSRISCSSGEAAGNQDLLHDYRARFGEEDYQDPFVAFKPTDAAEAFNKSGTADEMFICTGRDDRICISNAGSQLFDRLLPCMRCIFGNLSAPRHS